MSEEIRARTSKRQRELLSFVDGFIKGHGYGPSYREIMRALGYKSVSTVATHVDGLIARGYMIKRDNSARSLEVVTTLHAGPSGSQKDDHELWLVARINDRLERLRTLYDERTMKEAEVLIGALKILGYDASHKTAYAKLRILQQDHPAAD